MEREFCAAAKEIMKERFGHDNVIALATQCGGVPYVRYVNAYYEDGCFYVITYALSEKMRHIGETPIVAIAGEWFSGHGAAENLGWFSAEENASVAEKLRHAFAEWIDNGHNDFTDKNTIILRIRLTQAVLLSHGTRYAFDANWTDSTKFDE